MPITLDHQPVVSEFTSCQEYFTLSRVYMHHACDHAKLDHPHQVRAIPRYNISRSPVEQ